MKILVMATILTCVALLASAARADEPAPEVGWTRAATIEAMGEPRGFMTVGPLEMLYYERGRVQLRDGIVESVDLVSEAEAQRVREEREALRAREAEARERRRRARIEEGLAERERILDVLRTDDAGPATEVRLWEDFARRYPEVPVGDQLAAARSRLVEEREREELRRRVAELEARTREAERRAWAAEEAARLDRRRAVWVVPHAPRRVYTCPQRASSVRVDWQPTERTRIRFDTGGPSVHGGTAGRVTTRGGVVFDVDGR